MFLLCAGLKNLFLSFPVFLQPTQDSGSERGGRSGQAVNFGREGKHDEAYFSTESG